MKHKKQLLFVLLLINMPAWAEWTIVGGGDDARFSTYADITTIRRQDNVARMWTLVDFRNPQRAPYGPEYLSLKAQQEYDCTGRRSKLLTTEFYPGQMGNEDVVATRAGPNEWEPVPSEGIKEALWKVACEKP